MKNSNKLLLGGFLAVLVLVTILHVTIYARYKSGDYTIYNADDIAARSMQSFPNILFVSVRNVPSASVQFTDVAQVQSEDSDGIQYVRNGDTLTITGKEATIDNDFGSRVSFNLPYNVRLSMVNSVVGFRPGKKNGENSPIISLQNSKAIFTASKGGLLQFGRIQLTATDSSVAAFHGNVQTAQLDVQLSQSSLEYMAGSIGELTILADSLSTLTLPTKHLSKAKIQTISPQ